MEAVAGQCRERPEEAGEATQCVDVWEAALVQEFPEQSKGLHAEDCLRASVEVHEARTWRQQLSAFASKMQASLVLNAVDVGVAAALR